MPARRLTGYAFNRTRQAQVAARLTVAATHWSRFRGLMGVEPSTFRAGDGLWIVPCHGVHTFAMNFPIDVIYLDSHNLVVHLEENLKPWRLARVHWNAHSVLELPANMVRSTRTTIGDEFEIVAGDGEARPA